MKTKVSISKAVAALAITPCLYVTVTNPAVAQADIDIPGPGSCDYPGVSDGGLFGIGTYYYWCDFPTEENGSHWHAELEGVAGVGTIGVSFLFVNANVGAQVGVIHVFKGFRCPDNSPATPPLHPGQWSHADMIPKRCVPLGDPVPTPNVSGTQGSSDFPAVTNPTPGNPDLTQNPKF